MCKGGKVLFRGRGVVFKIRGIVLLEGSEVGVE